MADRKRHTAGAFDIRNVIGALLGLYGIALLITGMVSDEAPQATGDIDANIWTGIGLIAVAVSFLVWSRLRPTVVDEKAVAKARENRDEPPSGH
jgi:hypothetical protein